MVLESNIEKVRVMSTKSPTAAPMAESGLEDCLEAVVQWVAARRGNEYFVQPLETFLAQWGKAFPEDPFYQDRMNYFLEHSILERPMTGHPGGLTPFMAFLKESAGVQLVTNKAWQSFCDFRHSVYEVIKSGAAQIMVRDLSTHRLYKVVPKDQETLKFMAKKTIFQGFIFSAEDGYSLGQGIIIHPDKARAQILRFMKAQKKLPRLAEDEVLRLIAFTNMRFLRMQHVDPAIIYGKIFTETK